MKLSISKAGESIWVWLLWGLGIYLALELGPFLIAKQVFNKTAGDLAGPYLAFALPAVVVMPLIWWLRKWEERGASPKRVARGWGTSVALFGVAVVVAVFYSGIELRLMNPRDAIGGFVASVLLSVPIFYFGIYHRALKVISTRATGKQMPRSDGASSPS
jgi:hypothetical protein